MSASNANPRLQPESQSLEYSLSRQGRKLMLRSSLLVTTDLEPLLRGFWAEARSAVPCDGFEFVSADGAIALRDGAKRQHSCRYNLKVKDWVAGKMTFTRGYRFNKEELAVLESLLAELMLPLRRALTLRSGPENRLPRDRGAASTAASELPDPERESARLKKRLPEQTAADRRPLSLLPLESGAEEEGGEATELLAQLSKLNLANLSADEPRTSGRPKMALGPNGKLSHERRASLMESIRRRGIDELELFREARAVLGPLVYSDEALVFMSVFSDEASNFSEKRSA